jgi:nucleoside-triphosphatase
MIIGNKSEGKSELAESIVRCLLYQGKTIQGIIEKGFWKGNQRSHFVLHDISTTTEMTLCKTEKEPHWLSLGSYYFNPEAIQYGNRLFDNTLITNPDLVVVDEVGKLELEGNLWDLSIQKLLMEGNFHQLWTVRRDFVRDAISYYNLKHVGILEVGKTSLQEACREILSEPRII